MLEIKVASDQDTLAIQELFSENKLSLDSWDRVFPNSMIAYDNGNAVAAAGFSYIEKEAAIQYIVVQKRRQREYIGDGIVKALLNFADKKGIKWVYVKGRDIYHFLKRVGFEEISYDHLIETGSSFIKNQFSKEDIIFTTTLPDFFLRACRSNKS